MTDATDVDDLITVRDMLRYAVSRFRAGSVEHAHGATTALDEAAFMVLESLSLPVDDINPWLDARLTRSERARVIALIEARVTTRMPAAYLLGRTYLQGRAFKIDPRAIVPRSFISELLFSDALAPQPDASDAILPETILNVLDLCTGCGCLAVLAAERFPDARIDASDLSDDALALAAENVALHGLTSRINLFSGDLFAPLGDRRYDLILCNPPYVTDAEMAVFPPEFAAEPILAHAGGADGLDIVRRILAEAARHLTPGGGLLCEVGLARMAGEAIWPDLPFLWLDTADSDGEVFWITREQLDQT